MKYDAIEMELTIGNRFSGKRTQWSESVADFSLTKWTGYSATINSYLYAHIMYVCATIALVLLALTI